MDVFIGTGASLEDRRAAQNQRWALNKNASAAAMATTAAAASAAEECASSASPPQVVLTSITEGTLPPAAVQGGPQAAAGNRAPTPRSETGNCTSTPGPEEHQALIKFPGEHGVMRASMIPFLLVIFRLMVQIHPHVEVGSRNRRATTKLMELFDCFFDRADGTGRSFQMWVGNHGWKKFRKAVIAGVHGHAQAYEDNTGAPMEIQMLAQDLELEIMHTNSELQANRGARAETAAAHQEHLGAVEGGMGLTIPVRGVQPPTLDFPLDNFQVQALAELGQSTVSPFNPSNSTAGPTVTPRMRGSIHSCTGRRSAGGKQPP